MVARSLTALLAAREAGASRQSAPGRRRAADGEDVAGALRSWAEADSLRHCSASYCPLSPSPRSTIAAAFSPDGTLLASTHGDHTVKLICCRTGECVRTLTGHRRTPWVVRFHPRNSALLASGSLDFEVRVWDAAREVCIASCEYGRPIASLAFFPDGELLAVASGHKLFLWQYAVAGAPGAPPPAVALKTRRSLRAVHFHPRGGALLLTAEVNDAAAAAEAPPPAATTRPAAVQPGAEWDAAFAALRAVTSTRLAGDQATYLAAGPQARQQAPDAPPHGVVSMTAAAAAAAAAAVAGVSDAAAARMETEDDGPAAMEEDAAPSAAAAPLQPPGLLIPIHWQEAPPAQPAPAAAAATAAAAASAAAAAAAAAETPCTVMLRLWGFSGAAVDAAAAAGGALRSPLQSARLTIPHAVLCSEMGAHFSPCGRYLAACAACSPLAPSAAAAAAAAAAPPDAAAPPPSLVYELRVYSLAPESFGTVLAARAVRAAPCLTSIQFSPTSEHILLAYGRRHMDLLRSFVASGGSVLPVHTVLEVYRLRDMALVRQLPSAEDEVNVACFHPHAGGGVAYGTKEGRVRLLRHERGALAHARSRRDAVAAAAAAAAAPAAAAAARTPRGGRRVAWADAAAQGGVWGTPGEDGSAPGADSDDSDA